MLSSSIVAITQTTTNTYIYTPRDEPPNKSYDFFEGIFCSLYLAALLRNFVCTPVSDPIFGRNGCWGMRRNLFGRKKPYHHLTPACKRITTTARLYPVMPSSFFLHSSKKAPEPAKVILSKEKYNFALFSLALHKLHSGRVCVCVCLYVFESCVRKVLKVIISIVVPL